MESHRARDQRGLTAARRRWEKEFLDKWIRLVFKPLPPDLHPANPHEKRSSRIISTIISIYSTNMSLSGIVHRESLQPGADRCPDLAVDLGRVKEEGGMEGE